VEKDEFYCKLFDDCLKCPYPCCIEAEDSSVSIEKLTEAGFSEVQIADLLGKVGKKLPRPYQRRQKRKSKVIKEA